MKVLLVRVFFDFIIIAGILIPASDGSPEFFQVIAVIMFLVSYIVGVRRGKNLNKVEAEN